MYLFVKLRNLDALTASEQVLVQYILAHPKKVLFFSPKELATHAYVSVSTIYRLVNKLKLDGLNDLKLLLANELNDETFDRSLLDINYPISAEDHPDEITRRLEVLYEQTIASTIEINSSEKMGIYSELLAQATSIDIYASSANIYFAQNFQFQMQEIGKSVTVPVDDYMQNLTAANSTAEHLAIVVSYEGRGSSVKKILRILDKNNSKILLITARTSPLLKENISSVFFLPSLENHYNKLSSFSTRTALLYIFDRLYLSYFNQQYDKHIAYKLANYQKMNPKLI